MAEQLTEAQLIEQKLQLTQMQLEASTSFQAISEMLRGIMDSETVLYTVEIQAINKLDDIYSQTANKLEEMTRKNEQLKANNLVLAGVKDADVDLELTDDEKEYMAVMEDSEGE